MGERGTRERSRVGREQLELTLKHSGGASRQGGPTTHVWAESP